MKNWKLWNGLILSVAAGYALWNFWPIIGGAKEPWDASPLLYISILAALGFVFGFIGNEKPWIWFLSIYGGQFLFCLISSIKDFRSHTGGANFFIPLGVIFLFVCSVPAFLGSCLGYKMRRVWSHTVSPHKPTNGDGKTG
jgi:hypothetical protein